MARNLFLYLLLLGLTVISSAATNAADTLSSGYTDSGAIKGTSDASYKFTDWQLVLAGISIQGPNFIASGDSHDYDCTYYKDWSGGTGEKPPQPEVTYSCNPTWWFSNSDTTYASVSSDGVVTNKNTTTSPIIVTLQASYKLNGDVRIDRKSIILEGRAAKTLSSVSIYGASTLDNGSSYTYSATAYFSDGTSSTVTSSATWSLSSRDYASLSGSKVTNKNTTTSAKTVTLNATYTYGGTAITQRKEISLRTGWVLGGIHIWGDDSIASGDSYEYDCSYYLEWTGPGETPPRHEAMLYCYPTWWLSDSDTTYASVSSDGVVTNKNTTTSTKTVTLHARYTLEGTTKTDSKTISLAQPIVLGTALDNTSLTWTTGGDANWVGQAAETHDGVDAAQSGTINDSQSSYLETTVNGGGTIRFWWKVSSEEKYDKLSFSIDGTDFGSISGEQDWAQVTQAITTTGTHVLKWTYRKDTSLARGSDCGWVDQFTWTPYSLAISPATRSIASSATTGSISVSSNTSWTVSKDVSWITLGTTSGSGDGTLSYSVAANTSTSSRVGTITVSANGCDPKTLVITQKGLVIESIQIHGDTVNIEYDEIVEYSCMALWNNGATSRIQPRWTFCSNEACEIFGDGGWSHYDVVIETNGSFKNEFIDARDENGILYVHNINATSEDEVWITPILASYMQNDRELRAPGDYSLTLYRGEKDLEEFELNVGWNLITSLRYLDSDSKQKLMTRNAFLYDIRSKSYVKATADNILPGVPLWIYCNDMHPETSHLSVYGVKVPSNFQIERKPGWNLVGISIPTMGPGWEWTSTHYRLTDILETGKPYWIFEDAQGNSNGNGR